MLAIVSRTDGPLGSTAEQVFGLRAVKSTTTDLLAGRGEAWWWWWSDFWLNYLWWAFIVSRIELKRRRSSSSSLLFTLLSVRPFINFLLFFLSQSGLEYTFLFVFNCYSFHDSTRLASTRLGLRLAAVLLVKCWKDGQTVNGMACRTDELNSNRSGQVPTTWELSVSTSPFSWISSRHRFKRTFALIQLLTSTTTIPNGTNSIRSIDRSVGRSIRRLTLFFCTPRPDLASQPIQGIKSNDC